MIYWAYISVAFLGFQLFNVLLNIIFPQNIRGKYRSIPNVTVSILIPARNEEKNIGYLLDSLRNISKINLEVVVYDDQSEDNTVAIVEKFMVTNPKLHLIESKELPTHWLGKNHACYQLAKVALGDYLLFIDADVMLEKGLLEDAISFMKSKQLALLSIFPYQQQNTIGEKATVPIMNYILLTLLPLIFVRISPFSSHSAANGQFMLFDAATYRRIQPHQLFRNSPVEDIAISRYYKREKIRIACITGDKRVRCRMYQSYRESLNGFTKNVFMFFGNQPFFAVLFWGCATLGVVPVVSVNNSYLFPYVIVIILIQVGVSKIGRQNPLYNVALLPIHLLFLIHVILKALLTSNKKGHLWKGRNIYTRSLTKSDICQ